MILQRSLFLLVLFFMSSSGFGRQIPAENSHLNYTTVYFEDNFVPAAKAYQLEVYTDSLLTRVFARSEAVQPAFWLKDMNWASDYYWKVSAIAGDGKVISVSPVHKFSIIKIVYQSYDEIRFDVKTNKEDKNMGGVISIDYTKSIIDRKGRQVWAIPPLDGVAPGKMYIRDMRITKDNTITFLTFQVPYEVDFNGKIVWQAPYPFVMSSDTINYHHDFKKTSRGTYMVLGERSVYRRLLGQYSDLELKNSPDVKLINGELYKKTLITLLLEFDKAGNLLWYWDANDYVKDIDLNSKKVENSTPNFATHANAFGENKEGTKVYVGFRDLSRIVKIDKKTKKAELSYGEVYPSGEALIPVAMKNQHDANPSDHNSIYVFNNNGFKDVKGISSILELADNITPKENAVIWKFDLNFDTLTKGKSVNGGNIVELPNKNLLFCAGSLHRIFEITKSKEIVWDVLLFFRGIKDTLWQPFPQYRCNWAPQLNWYYFMAKQDAPLVKEGRSCTSTLSIYNTGNVEDTYEIEVKDKTGKIIYTSKPIVLKQNTSVQEVLKFRTKDALNDLKVLVHSANAQKDMILTD